MLVRTFEIEIGRPSEVGTLLEHEDMRAPGVEPDIENVVDLLPVGGIVDQTVQKALFGALLEPGICALTAEGGEDSVDQFLRAREVPARDDRSGLLVAEHGERNAPGALPRHHPIGARLDHTSDAVLALRRDPARRRDRSQRALPQRVAARPDILVDGDEPLRRGAEDHRLFRAPGMRIVVLVAGAGDQRAGLGQRGNHREIGVAELALVVDHTLALEARRFPGEEAGLIDRERNAGVDSTRLQRGLVLFPDLEILRTVAGCGMDEARAGIFRHMLAG
jgi:hypothetical protein